MKKAILIILTITMISSLLFTVNCKFNAGEVAVPVRGTTEEETEEVVTEEITNEESDSEEQIIEEESTSNDQTNEEEAVEEDEEQANEKASEESEKTEESNEQEQVAYSNDFSLQDIDGNIIYLSNYQGKVVVLNFWATWCGPCVAEIPDFVEVYNQYKNRDVQFIGVSLDSDMNALKQFVSENKMNYPVLIDDNNVSTIWNIEYIPTTYILDRNGNILTSRVGQMAKSDLINLIEDNI